nr:PREDICTED: uncharacterized protein LOC109030516 [Bemisia tabaci]
MAQCALPVSFLLTLLLSRCSAVLAILHKKVYAEEDLRRNYRLEDFLWTGSGDGEDGESGDHSWQTTTVFQTTTILTTIYSTPVYVRPSMASVDCIGGEECSIQPTPTLNPPSATAEFPASQTEAPFQTVPEPKYWVITVLKVNATLDLNPTKFEPRLARLYRIAFNRQQALHLGWNGSGYWNSSTALQFAKQVIRRRREKRDVSVRVHNLRSAPGTGSLELVYSVRVAGRPVLALAAARDMRLVSEGEATSELGYPVETKAEPYLRSSEAVSEAAARSRDTWLLIGSGLSAVILFIILIAIFILGYNSHKRKQKSRVQGNLNKSRVFEREAHRGISNIAFQDDQPDAKTGSRASLSHHSISEQSDISEAALVRGGGLAMINPPATTPTPTPKPRSARVSSPNSYLSMPSVKAFPRRAKIPEPLNQVLAEDSKSPVPKLTRHGSVEGNDPGVVGPIVWDLHCHRLYKQAECLELEDDPSLIEPNVGRMRRRFHQLLDDAFSLFGSPPPSPSPTSSRSTSIDIRAKSALVRPVCDIHPEPILRPRTSADAADACGAELGAAPEARRSAGVAWGSVAAPSPSSPPAPGGRSESRPLSAGPFHRPCIEPQFVLAQATLPPTDPAVPIISAIKQELERLPTRNNANIET